MGDRRDRFPGRSHGPVEGSATQRSNQTVAKAKAKSKAKAAAKPVQAEPSATRIKLQIAGAVFVPMLGLGLWLNSKGFFG